MFEELIVTVFTDHDHFHGQLNPINTTTVSQNVYWLQTVLDMNIQTLSPT